MNLEQLALDIRRDSIEMIYRAGSGHPGGCLSCADILAYLFGKELKGAHLDPNRDRFILSKGHAAPALYSALKNTNPDFNNVDLCSLRKFGSPLQGHPSVTHIPEVETSTGSLGQGFSVGVGMALGLKLRGSKARVFVLLGEGDIMEGIFWESLAFAGHHNLTNLIAILDYNKYTSDSFECKNWKDEQELIDRIVSFGWELEPTNGNSIEELDELFEYFDDIGYPWPMFALAHTIKGKGVSFMEGPDYHGSMTLTKDEYERAMECLNQ